MTLLQAFAIGNGSVVALVGGGGKTSLMFALAKAATPAHSVITTTTTKIFVPNPEESAVVWIDGFEALAARWQGREACIRHATLAAGLLEAKGKLIGLRPESVNRLARARTADILLIEADGAKGRSLKAPHEAEPVIPAAANTLIAVIGIDAIGRPFNEETVFRIERARRLIGAPPGGLITPEWAAALVTHPYGICKGAPGHARMIFSINKVESPEAEQQARRLAEQIRRFYPRPIAAIVAGSLRKTEPGHRSGAWQVLDRGSPPS